MARIVKHKAQPEPHTPLGRLLDAASCVILLLSSSMVEHSAVNRRVVGSSPT